MAGNFKERCKDTFAKCKEVSKKTVKPVVGYTVLGGAFAIVMLIGLLCALV